MKKIKQNNRENHWSYILMLNIFLSIIPYIISSAGKISNDRYQLVVIGSFFLQSAILIFFTYYKKIKFPLKKISSLIILILIFLFILLIQLLTSNLEFSYFDIFYTFARIFTMTMYLFVLTEQSLDKSGLFQFVHFLVKLAIILCVANIMLNFKYIIPAFTSNQPYKYNFQSLFLNRNTFAQFLTLTLMIMEPFKNKYRKSSFTIIKLVLLFNLLITFSRASISTYLIFYILYSIFISKNKFKVILFITITTTLIITVYLLNDSINVFVNNMLLRTNVGTSGRKTLWMESFNFVLNNNFLTGVGEFTATNYLAQQGLSQTQMHSMYIDLFLTGGLILIILFVVMLMYLISKYKWIYKRDYKYGTYLISSTFSVLVYGVFESIKFFSVGYVPTIFTIIYITIPIMYYKTLQKDCLKCIDASKY